MNFSDISSAWLPVSIRIEIEGLLVSKMLPVTKGKSSCSQDPRSSSSESGVYSSKGGFLTTLLSVIALVSLSVCCCVILVHFKGMFLLSGISLWS